MFDSEDKVKDFILWAKKNKVRYVKVEGLEFTLSNGAIYLPDSPEQNADPLNGSTKTEGESDLDGLPVSGSEDVMDDETLFHSAN